MSTMRKHSQILPHEIADKNWGTQKRDSIKSLYLNMAKKADKVKNTDVLRPVGLLGWYKMAYHMCPSIYRGGEKTDWADLKNKDGRLQI